VHFNNDQHRVNMKVQDWQNVARNGSIIAGIALLSMLAASCDMPKGESAKAVTDGKPKIMIVGGDSISWGKVGPGVLKRELKIVNAGGGTLKIGDVRPSCGCTTAPLDKKELGPGDTGTVEVSMDVTTRSGGQHKTLTINSNDSTRPALVIGLTADVMRDLTTVPETFRMVSEAKTGVEDTTSIQITNTGTEPVTVEPPTIPQAPEMIVRFDMSAPRQLAPGESLRVVAHVRAIKEGPSSTDVIFPTSSKIMPQLKVSLMVNATGKG
jgi:hypothetical protein